MIGTVTDDHTIGIANGKLNGSSNGITNGHTNGHTNGLTNGATNGHANGHCDTEHAKTDAYNFRNPSLFVTPDHQLKMVDGPIEKPGPGEVTLQIKCSGICG